MLQLTFISWKHAEIATATPILRESGNVGSFSHRLPYSLTSFWSQWSRPWWLLERIQVQGISASASLFRTRATHLFLSTVTSRMLFCAWKLFVETWFDLECPLVMMIGVKFNAVLLYLIKSQFALHYRKMYFIGFNWDLISSEPDKVNKCCSVL